MFDNLRDDADNAFYEVDDSDLFPEEEVEAVATPPKRRGDGKLLGMTGIQRFIIALMLMFAVCMLGTICLVLTGKIGLV
jgi:hypothetical protein